MCNSACTCISVHTHTRIHVSLFSCPHRTHTFCRMTFFSYMILWGSDHKLKSMYSRGKCLSLICTSPGAFRGCAGTWEIIFCRCLAT